MKNELPIMPIRAMYAEKSSEGKDLDKGGFDPSAIEAGDVPQDAVLGLDAENKIVKGDLFGKYATVLKGEEIDPRNLTEFQENAIKSGALVNGPIHFTDYTDQVNPVYFPIYGGKGLSISNNKLQGYRINDNHVLSYFYSFIEMGNDFLKVSATGKLQLESSTNQIELNSKLFPAYPANQTDKRFYFVLDDRTLKWQEGNGLYLHNLTFTDSTNATRYLSVITDSATPFDIVSGTGPTLVQCEDASIIIVPDSGKSLPMYNNKSFHPTVYSLSFPSGSTSVEYTSYNISTIDEDLVSPL